MLFRNKIERNGFACAVQNVTIVGSPDQDAILDLDFQQDILDLCSRCVLTFATHHPCARKVCVPDLHSTFAGT